MPVDLLKAIAEILGICGINSIRMFIPTFMFLLYARCPALHPENVTAILQKMPPWLLSMPALLAFAILALVEFLALQDPDLEEILTESLDKYVKAIFNAIIIFGFVDAYTAQQASEILNAAPATASLAAASVAVISMPLTYSICHWRNKFLPIFRELDPDDSLNLQILRNLGETLLLPLLLVILIVSPLLVYLLAGVLITIFFLCHKILSQLNQKHIHTCLNCGFNEVKDAALCCPKCQLQQENPKCLSFWGLTTNSDISSCKQHQFQLLLSRRCPSCASLLPRGTNCCPVCGNAIWTTGITWEEYISRVDNRSTLAAAICLPVLFLPVIGLIFAVVVQKIVMLRPFQHFLSPWQNFMSRMLLKILTLAILMLAIWPLMGWLFLVPMALSYVVARSHF